MHAALFGFILVSRAYIALSRGFIGLYLASLEYAILAILCCIWDVVQASLPICAYMYVCAYSYEYMCTSIAHSRRLLQHCPTYYCTAAHCSVLSRAYIGCYNVTHNTALM